MKYRVVASALNLRASASATAARLAVLPRDAVAASVDDPNPTPGWQKVSWNGTVGFASVQYLAPETGDPGASITPPATGTTLPPAPPVEARDRSVSKLHPIVRQNIIDVVAQANQEGLPFQIFEAFRTPERQRWLYAQGRTASGKIVTKAQAWQSMHQYGLAADLVLFVNGQWSWSGPGSSWQRMHEIAKAHGLQWLSFEAPHVELAGADWQSYQAGRLPAGGDDTWYEAVSAAAERWRRANGQPAGPPIQFAERPPLDDQGDGEGN